MDTYQELMRSGAMAGLASATLFGGLSRQPILNNVPLIPSKVSCAGFGGAFALGTWMIYDGDYKNGAGFVSVWSLLYMFVNGRGLKQRGLYPKATTALIFANFAGYAQQFISTPPTKPLAVEQPPPTAAPAARA